MPRQYDCAGVNPPASCRRLVKQIGRQAANYSLLSGIFTSVYHAQSTPIWWTVARGLYARWFLFASTANLAICPPPTRFAALSGLKRPNRNNAMNKIRKAFSRPIYAHKLRSFATFEEACNMVDSLTTRNSDFYRFLIEQTATGWTVSRIAQGSAA